MIDVMGLVKAPYFLLKIVELVVGCICTGLISNSNMVGINFPQQQTIIATLIGYIPLNILLVTGYCIGHPIHRFLVLMVTVSGAFMFLVAGAFLFVSFDKISQGLIIGAAILAIGNTCVYCLDTFVTFKYGEH